MSAASRLIHEYWFGIRVVVMCMLWYSCSSGQSIINKLTLQLYPYPLTIALSSLLNNVIYAVPLIKILHIKQVRITPAYFIRTIGPISLGRAVAVASAYFGLYKVPVSYAQTVKATMPVFTVLISRVLLNDRQTQRVYASLVPIIVGVCTASATELQFDALGLASSLLSTSVFAYLNVLAKKVFEETGMHPISLLSLNSQLASVILFPVWVLHDGYAMWTAGTLPALQYVEEELGSSSPPLDIHFIFCLFASGACSFLQNLCAFVLIHQLTTLSYAVSNAAKRIFVIVLSLVTLRNPVTVMNLVGMAMSIFGVFLYNRMKATDRTHKNVTFATMPTHSAGHDDGGISDNVYLLRRGSEDFAVKNLHSSKSDVQLLMSAT